MLIDIDDTLDPRWVQFLSQARGPRRRVGVGFGKGPGGEGGGAHQSHPHLDPRWVQFYLKHAAPAVALAWVSARGRGVKVGVLTNPIPTAGQNVDAWGAAYTHIGEVLKAAGMTESVDYKIDATPAAAQLAILAHDPSPLVRQAELAVKWSTSPSRRRPSSISAGL